MFFEKGCAAPRLFYFFMCCMFLGKACAALRFVVLHVCFKKGCAALRLFVLFMFRAFLEKCRAALCVLVLHVSLRRVAPR